MPAFKTFELAGFVDKAMSLLVAFALGKALNTRREEPFNSPTQQPTAAWAVQAGREWLLASG